MLCHIYDEGWAVNNHSLKFGRIQDEHNQDISDAVGNRQELHQTLTQATEIVSLHINSYFIGIIIKYFNVRGRTLTFTACEDSLLD